ncbi:EAL domain-containing protein [Microvirga sp. VF16]|uniref:bifunctional diguanylate cyclase/phosphodiesterase n=1 Tax=Microvirga sp. VF16 TaxID=2807101 RepID=UPI00193DE092|nr:EAL domain-containing protein [Microvirga sp. VF16]QRM35648.1 EAL domain-containing protein [Microvirga sp. VF16]
MSMCGTESSVPLWAEADRLAALRSFAVLDTEPETTFDSLTKVAAHVCDAPVALISLIDEQRQWFKCAIGLNGVREIPREIAICAQAILQPDLFVVPDATKDPRFSTNPLVTGEPHLRFYAGAPLITEEGLPLGTLCVFDTKPRPEGLTPAQREALPALANAVMSQLKLRQANRVLEEHQRELITLTDALPQMIWSACPDKRLDHKNRRWYEFTGTEPGFAERNHWTSLIHPEDRDQITALWQHSLHTGEPYECRYRQRHHSGEYRWILSRATASYDPQERVRRWYGTNTDIHEWKQAEEDLARSEKRYRTLIEASTALVWRAEPDGSLISNSHDWQALSGQAPGEGHGNGWLKAVHPADRERVMALWQDALACRQPVVAEFRVEHPDAEDRWVRAKGVPMLDEHGTVQEWVGTITDIHEQKCAAEHIRQQEERHRALVQASSVVLWVATPDGMITETRGWADITGQSDHEAAGLGSVDTLHADDTDRITRAWLEAVASGTAYKAECRVRHKSGEYRWMLSRAVPIKNADGSIREWVGGLSDIHDRKVAECELWRSANHDALTGLPNRMLFQNRLEQALADAKQHGTSISLLVIDLDEFKDVNDSFGHDAGDALLKETAVRLCSIARKCDTVARFGGDEFVVLLAGSTGLEHAATLAEGLAKKLSQPVPYAGQMIASHASIGVAAFPDHDATAPELMKDADMALYRAKAEGRNRVVTYLPEMRAATEHRVTLRREMREAISLDQIQPFYQPKVCLATGEIVGFEALARWQHPTRGLVTPGSFADAFDDPELATTVGKRLIGKVTSDMRRWLNSGLSFGHVAINLSQVEFIQPGLAEDILRILDLAKVPPKHLEIEITEKVLLDAQSEAVSDALDRFRARGVQIALDDFGTGYASLTHLKQFAVDHIKIDRSFVRDIEEDPDDEAIVTAVVSLGRSLNLKVTAEGVETTGQAQRLREMGCGSAQGYLYASPMAGADVPGFLAGWFPQQISAKRLLLIEK